MVEDEGGKHKIILELGSQRVGMIDALFVKGLSASKIRKVIQDEWKLLTEYTPAALNKRLTRYRKDNIDRHMKVITKDEETGQEIVMKKKFDPLVPKVNALEAMQEMVEVQMARVTKVKQIEDKMPTATGALDKQLTLLNGMLRNLAVLQLEVGHIQRVPKKVQGDFYLLTPEGSKTHNDIKVQVEAHDEIQRRTHRVFQLLDQFKEQRGLTLEHEPD